MSDFIHIDKLLNIPVEKITKINHSYNVKLHDNEIVTINGRELHLSLYFWGILKRFNTPVTKNFLLSNYYKNGYYTKSTLNAILSAIKESIVYDTLIPTYMNTNPIEIRYKIDELHKDMLVTTNRIYNELIFTRLEFMSTLSIEYLLELQLDNRLMKAMEEVAKYKNNISIQKAYNVLDKVLNDPKYKDNPIARGYKSGLLNKNQVKQVLGPRGFVTELDNKIFQTPIVSSFTLGLKDMYEIVVESRSAAKALAATDTSIQKSEYFARLLQIVTMVVTNITVGDCGNTDYQPFYVASPSDTYSGDLQGLIGKYYYDEELKREKRITKDSTKLIGKTIKLRVIQHCRTPNKYHICSKCLGGVTWSIPSHYNIGHLSATVLTQVLTQSLLSLKHLITSASTRKIELPANIAKYFTTKGVKFYISDKYSGRDHEIKLKIEQEQVEGFKIIKNRIDEILSTIDTESYKSANSLIKVITDQLDTNVMKITWISDFIIEHTVKRGINQGVYYTKFDIKKVTKNIGHLSLPFIIWAIVNNKWVLTDDNEYLISTKGYNPKKHVLELPEKEYDFTQLINEVRKLIRSNDNDKSSVSGPMSLLSKLFTTVNEKVDNNIALLEVIVYALTVVNPTDNNYDLSRNSEGKVLAPLTELSKYRSLMLGDNDVRRKLFNNAVYLTEHKPHSPLDVFLTPNEVLKDIEDGTRLSNHKISYNNRGKSYTDTDTP